MTRPHAERSLGECFRCLENDQMMFEVITDEGLDGYAFPGSAPMPYGGDMVLTPLPYMWILSTFAHSPVDDYGYGWPHDWTRIERCLLGFVPTLKRGEPYNLSENHGHVAGERSVPGTDDIHPFKWLITGRHIFDEVELISGNKLPGTANTGFALSVHRSRQLAGSLPDDTTLAQWWHKAVNHSKEPLATYNDQAASHARIVRP